MSQNVLTNSGAKSRAERGFVWLGGWVGGNHPVLALAAENGEIGEIAQTALSQRDAGNWWMRVPVNQWRRDSARRSEWLLR